MKNINEIALVEISGQESESMDDASKRKTWAFVSSVMSLYHAGIDVSKLDGVKATCLTYHATINGYTDKEYADRLKMIKAVASVPNMPGLYCRYGNAQEALRAACGELCNLQHDYGLVTPKNYNTGALEEIKRKELEHNPENDQYGKETIKSLKGLF